jgi:RNA polymerase sigma factor (sigma-70 family)
MTRQELESLFLANLPVIERILDALARRKRLVGDDADEFGAWAKLRLIEQDYAVFAKFRGDSTLPTYLTMVVAMLFREYRVQEWGRWRPSAAAKRGGELAKELEILVCRDGMSINQAGQVLRTSGKTTMSDRELAELAAEFPRRTRLRPVQSEDVPATAEAEDRADASIEAAEADAEVKKVNEALNRAMAAMPPEDRLILRLSYKESMSVAQIARALALPQKPLYRRLDRLLGRLRAALARDGITRDPRDFTDAS